MFQNLQATRELEKLRELEDTRTEFLHRTSHELKTPLTAMLAGVELLQMDAESLGPEQRELVAMVYDGAIRMRSLIGDLLSMSALEGKQVQLNLEQTDIPSLLQRAVSRLAPAARSRVTLTIDPGVPRVLIDRARIEEIVDNLVSNALKYSPGGGQVRIEATATGQTLAVAVSDSGLGIPESELPRIFEKFYRVNAHKQLEIGGTGLGLSIAKHIAELHHGELTVQSQVGQGSTFTFTLPVGQTT